MIKACEKAVKLLSEETTLKNWNVPQSLYYIEPICRGSGNCRACPLRSIRGRKARCECGHYSHAMAMVTTTYDHAKYDASRNRADYLPALNAARELYLAAFLARLKSNGLVLEDSDDDQ